MQDRPTFDELLEAVAGFLRDDVMANTSGRLSFHARVSANVIDMLRRELTTMEQHNAHEWDGLDHLLGVEPMPPSIEDVRGRLLARNQALSERIRSGGADGGDWRAATLTHLRGVVRDKLEVSNPGWAGQ